MLKYTIQGDPRTKKNHMMIAGSGARCPTCGKHHKQWIRQGAAHDKFKESALWFLRPAPAKPIDYPINIKCLFYMGTHGIVDQLNLSAAIDDLLVDAKIIKDDNSRIVVSHDGTRVLYDKEHPRVEIYITEVSDAEFK